MAPLPLQGVRILEASEALALPQAIGYLADMGAQVIAIEHCARPNMFRGSGAFPDNTPDDNWWDKAGGFNQWARGKLSLTLDLNSSKGKEIFRSVVSISDVVVENFTSRVMANFGLQFEELKKIKEDLIMLSNTGYGHTGPWKNYVGMAQVVESLTTAEVSGYPDGWPGKSGQSIMDLVSAYNMVSAIMTALFHRDRTGEGQWIDHSMLQGCIPMASGALMDAAMNQRDQGRMGNRDKAMAPHGCYPCSGNYQNIVIAVSTDTEWVGLCKAMDMLELSSDVRFADSISRYKNQDELDEIICRWTKHQDKKDLMHALQREGVPAGSVNSNKDLLLDPQLETREYFELVTHSPKSGVGIRPYSSRGFRFSETPVMIQKAAPTLGEDNHFVLSEVLGMDIEEVKDLEKEHIIGDFAWDMIEQDGETQFVPQTPRVIPLPLQQQLEAGTIAGWDPDYKDILGLSG